MGQLRNCTNAGLNLKSQLQSSVLKVSASLAAGGISVCASAGDPSIPATQEPCKPAESAVTGKSLTVSSLSNHYFGGQEDAYDVRVGTLGLQFPTLSKPVKGQDLNGNCFTQTPGSTQPCSHCRPVSAALETAGCLALGSHACPQLPLCPPASPAAQHALRRVQSEHLPSLGSPQEDGEAVPAPPGRRGVQPGGGTRGTQAPRRHAGYPAPAPALGLSHQNQLGGGPGLLAPSLGF